jgi:hypothetical protein
MSGDWQGDTLNITCNFLYCKHQVHRDFLIVYKIIVISIMSSKKANHYPGDCVLLKYKCLVFIVRLGPKINSLACLWVLLRPLHLVRCWLSNQCIIFLLISRLDMFYFACGLKVVWCLSPLPSVSSIFLGPGLLPVTVLCVLLQTTVKSWFLYRVKPTYIFSFLRNSKPSYRDVEMDSTVHPEDSAVFCCSG